MWKKNRMQIIVIVEWLYDQSLLYLINNKKGSHLRLILIIGFAWLTHQQA